MRRTLTESAGLPTAVLWTLAIVAGISIANIYYIQPLLNIIRKDLAVSEFAAGLIAMITQAGYALGLLFIIPLGDLYQRKRIIVVDFIVLISALLTFGFSQHLATIMVASFLIGTCSVIPQIFIPIAAQFSTPELKGRNIGIIISGLLTGILASRVVSGLVGEWLGWRAMYFIAAGIMLTALIVILKTMPEMESNFSGTYFKLMRSLKDLIRKYPDLIVVSVRSCLAFGSFLAMWSCLAFKMHQAPFYADSHIIGLLGLCGIVGALSASFVSRYAYKVGIKRFNIIGCLTMLSAWASFYWGEDSYLGIIAGIILIDIGLQCVQLSNQAIVFSLNPKASNRVNTIFMTTFFVGGSTGTLFGDIGWHLQEWHGVIVMGILLVLCSLSVTLFVRVQSKQ